LPSPTPAPLLCRDDVFAGVWQPSRLRLINPCQEARGLVVFALRNERDGDVHINLLLSPGQSDLLCAGNRTDQLGTLVLEIIPGDQDAIPLPKVGQRIRVVGAHVEDLPHAWCEIHPVWSITIGGTTYSQAEPKDVPIPGEEDEDEAITPQ
jgi:hypothetical protein